MASYNVAFAAPEAPMGYGPSASKPIDLVHLARQTMGDRTVELEVLKIFARQARQCLAELSVADQDGKIATAHRLKGAAQAVGAFPLSKFAEEMEAGAFDAAHMAKMTAAITETENFINRLCR